MLNSQFLNVKTIVLFFDKQQHSFEFEIILILEFVY